MEEPVDAGRTAAARARASSPGRSAPRRSTRRSARCRCCAPSAGSCAANRFGIPALAHEECLAGFAAWGATAYPVPLAWGATFDPALVGRMAAAIGRDMRSVGVHQGLAPVLDVVRDARWGRVEETIGEDPYLVGTVGTAYVQGLESAGIVATLKHFAGYSASRAGRNLAPVGMGPRERADVILPPFEMAVREGGVRSVMHAYTDTDGIPSAADAQLLTGLLRDTWGFTGTVVADYFGVAFLKTLHGVAGTCGEAARRRARGRRRRRAAHRQGVRRAAASRRSPTGRCPRRWWTARCAGCSRRRRELGLLDADWDPVPAALAGAGTPSPEPRPAGAARHRGPGHRGQPRHSPGRSPRRAVVLLRNDGTLPLARPARIALIGPNADDPDGRAGLLRLPDARRRAAPAGAGRASNCPPCARRWPPSSPTARSSPWPGCGIDGADTERLRRGGRAGARRRRGGPRARRPGRAVRPRHQRRGLRRASRWNCPASSSSCSTRCWTPARRWWSRCSPGGPTRSAAAVTEAAAIVQSFFPGEEGTAAIAGVLSGRVDPSGRLPVSVPRRPGRPAVHLSRRPARPGRARSPTSTRRRPSGSGTA